MDVTALTDFFTGAQRSYRPAPDRQATRRLCALKNGQLRLATRQHRIAVGWDGIRVTHAIILA